VVTDPSGGAVGGGVVVEPAGAVVEVATPPGAVAGRASSPGGPAAGVGNGGATAGAFASGPPPASAPLGGEPPSPLAVREAAKGAAARGPVPVVDGVGPVARRSQVRLVIAADPRRGQVPSEGQRGDQPERDDTCPRRAPRGDGDGPQQGDHEVPMCPHVGSLARGRG
jgi:hypothetical protein